jgi:predicted 3-demethylubiquinone-9 3-methyltransferase (glyoxalase superfamily)
METRTRREASTASSKTQLQKITPFLWFDDQATEAVNFYLSVFSQQEGTLNTITRVIFYGEEAAEASGRTPGSVMTIAFLINGQEFAAMNGGPAYRFTPSVSFFVTCNTEQKINLLWSRLSEGGNILMNLNKYPFSEKFGWVNDKYGVSWQVALADGPQKITPCLMFSGNQRGKAEEAINFYTSLFKNSEITNIQRYGAEDTEPENTVKFARFSLIDQEFMAMDSNREHAFTFNPAISFVVNCESQDEIDYYWNELARGGDERAQLCGWLEDRYGVSWQILPSVLREWLSKPDTRKSDQVMQAILRMKKIDVSVLKNAYEQ